MTSLKSATGVRRIFVLAFILVACLSVLFVTTLSAQGPEGAQDGADDQASSGAVAPALPEELANARLNVPEDVLYDNGPLVNEPGGGPGGADGSVLQNVTLGMNILGFGHAVSSGFRVADDFTVDDPAGWQVDQITFYAYQTGSSTTSTITEVNYRIWDGDPSDPGSSVVFGDTTTNRLIDSTWSGIYRYAEDNVGTTRPIMANTVSAGFTLDAGTYWLDWQVGGSLTSGPWAPPITIDGQTTTGNGLQYNPSTGMWGPAEDDLTLTQQGFPFIIEGTIVGGPTPTASATATAGPSPTATPEPGLCADGNPPDELYFNDFETDDGGWVGSGFGEWEWGEVVVPGADEGCDSTTLPEPPGAYSGTNAWATNLDGCYANSGAASTLSQTFDFSDVEGPITLNWYQWYSIFGAFDYGTVYVNGAPLYEITTSVPTADWEDAMLDLSAYAGNASVTIEFELFATTVVNRYGWYIDDVQLTGCTAGTGPTPTATSTGVNPTATPTGGATSIQLGTLESDGNSNPWLLLALVGVAGLAGAAWVGARRSR